MKRLANLVSFLARRFLSREWAALQPKLAETYRNNIRDSTRSPSLLAQKLLITAEDHRFFHHGGIDPIATCRAVWRWITLGRHEGASTIEMQIVRVLSGNYERTLKRKMREMGLATLVSSQIPKHVLPAITYASATSDGT
jgi:membrane carboxypeptidase/penicillin-binding protein PbpC